MRSVSTRKCQAKGGSASCKDAKCPEKMDYADINRQLKGGADTLSYDEYAYLRDQKAVMEKRNPSLRTPPPSQVHLINVNGVAGERAEVVKPIGTRGNKTFVSYVKAGRVAKRWVKSDRIYLRDDTSEG